MKSTRLFAFASLVAACVIVQLAAQSAQTQTFKVLHSFQGNPDGAAPFAGVISDPKGNLYGTTIFGGAYGGGTVFKLTKTGKETVLYSFCSRSGCTDGDYPIAGLIRDAKGNLYGATYYGGKCDSDNLGCGTVFRLSPNPKGGWKETVLYRFTGGADGGYPQGGLIQDVDGSLYGTTLYGGNTACTNGCGTVFKLSTADQETVLYRFAGGSDGYYPLAGVIQGANGGFYGTTMAGGDYDNGTVFKLSRTGKEAVLYSFCAPWNCGDGALPYAGVIQDAKGNLYGTTEDGGLENCNGYGCGTVFRLSKTGNEIALYTFTGGADGAGPYGGVIWDAMGNLNGTTLAGGADDYGTVFKLSKTGQETVLHSFTGGADGAYPCSGVIQDAKGNLYGTTYGDNYAYAANLYGTVFKLTP